MSVEPGPGHDAGHREPLAEIAGRALRAHGRGEWSLRRDATWYHVHPTGSSRPVQGWKLHISATPRSAPLVLARCAEVLASYGAAFKFAAGVDQVARLASRRVDRGAGGKFITVYPDGDEDRLRDLAEALHLVTRGLPGPGILSDRRYQAGSLVHYRYGAFTGVVILGNDGMREAMLIAPDGRLARDHRKAWYCPPSWAPPDPFAPPGAAAMAAEPAPVLLAGRYLVTQAIRHSFAGGVFGAEDQLKGQPVIIKQARPHTDVGRDGRDACDKRRHEADMLRLLAPTGRVARLVELAEQQGDMFLVQERIDGITLREWVQKHLMLIAETQPGQDPAAAEQIARGLVDLMALIQQRGLVLGDFNPNNVMVTASRSLCLIDLETLTPAGQAAPGEFTPGYGAPETRAGDPADQAADRYSLGATLFYLASGADPVLPADDPGARPQAEPLGGWLSLVGARSALAGRLSPLILQLMDPDPARRPGLPAVRDALAAPPAAAAGLTATRDAIRLDGDRLDHAIGDGIGYLLDTMTPGDTGRLWPTSDRAASSDPFAVHHGAAGVLATLIRAQGGQPDPSLLDGISLAAGWIRRKIRSEPRTLPGLHFGHAGTAWVLLQAARLLDDQRLAERAEELARRLPLHWPNQDICHGASGAGMALLAFFELTRRADYLDRASQVADSVISAAQQVDGMVMWPIPQDFPSRLAGARHLGFAHGVAGIGAFLLAAGRATADQRCLSLARSAAATLVATAEPDNGAVYWPATPGSPRRTHWCSGSSGVGTFLLRAWQHDGDARHRELAIQAAAAVHRARWRADPSQCHGLAGDADFLLDLAQVLGSGRYEARARQLAECIYARHAIRGGRMVAPDETGTAVVPDYGVGQAGVLALLLRLRHGGPRLWLPQALLSRQPARTADPAKGGDSRGDRHRRTSDPAGGHARGRGMAMHGQQP